MPSHPQQHDPSGEACEPYIPGYVNLWEAIEQAGKGLYPGTWTGTERLRTPADLQTFYDPKGNTLYTPVNLSYAALLPTLRSLRPPQTNVEIEALTIFHNEGLNQFYLKVEQEEEKARLTPTLGFDEDGMMRCNLAMKITEDDVLEALNSEHKMLIEETFKARKRLKKLLEACRFCFLKSKVSAFWYNDETGKRNKIPAHTWSIKAAQLALESSHPGVWIKQRTELPVFVKDLALKKAVVQVSKVVVACGRPPLKGQAKELYQRVVDEYPRNRPSPSGKRMEELLKQCCDISRSTFREIEKVKPDQWKKIGRKSGIPLSEKEWKEFCKKIVGGLIALKYSATNRPAYLKITENRQKPR